MLLDYKAHVVVHRVCCTSNRMRCNVLAVHVLPTIARRANRLQSSCCRASKTCCVLYSKLYVLCMYAALTLHV